MVQSECQDCYGTVLTPTMSMMDEWDNKDYEVRRLIL